jgi:hypothetical protein
MGHLPVVAPIDSRELFVGAFTLLAILQWQQDIDVADLLGAITMLYRHILDIVKIDIYRRFTIL